MPPKPTQSKLSTEDEIVTNEKVQGLQTQVEEFQSQVTSIQVTISGIPVMQEAMTKITIMIKILLKDTKKATETPIPASPSLHQTNTITPTSFTPIIHLQNSNSTSSIKPPKIYLPSFDGSNPLDWIF